MSIPTTTDQYMLREAKGFSSLALEKDVPIPSLGSRDVLVQIEAVSLNFRDLIIADGTYPFPTTLPVVPCSDASATVLSTGPQVTQFQPGDRVCTLFNQTHQSGHITPADFATGLGGGLNGTLRRHAIFPETGLVLSPTNHTPLESATLSCAPLTAWNALYGLSSRGLKPGQTVLTQGSGGVSCAAIQFARAAGCTVIATTSSDAKAAKLRELGAHHVLNYNTDPNWGESAKRLTPNGAGVDHVIEVGGPTTVAQSLQAIKFEGVITIVGFLGGTEIEKQPSMLDALVHCCTVRGVLVGSRDQFREMVRAIEGNGIKGVVDEKVFRFEEAREAFQYVKDQKHFGNAVIQVS